MTCRENVYPLLNSYHFNYYSETIIGADLYYSIRRSQPRLRTLVASLLTDY
ncbi:hypothetical protein RB213_009238 [Colletotrichum asianum]